MVEAGKEVWVTIGEDAAADVSYESQARIEIPEYVEKFVVHAYVPLDWKTANLWAWSAPDGTNAFDAWPGQELKEGEDGWFTGKAPVWINSIIVNGNEGAVQTEDITYEDPNKTAEDITVCVKVPDDWTGPCLWAWSAPDGTNAFASWPGEALTQDGDWYTIQVPGWINSVIVNAGEGSVDPVPAETDPEPAPADDPAPANQPEPSSGSNTGLIVGGAAVAVVAVGGIALAVSKKKKK